MIKTAMNHNFLAKLLKCVANNKSFLNFFTSQNLILIFSFQNKFE
jgi:hypothetical protein